MTGTASRDSSFERVAVAAFVSMAFAAALMTGCTRQEKVLDVQTPAGVVEVYEEKPVTE